MKHKQIKTWALLVLIIFSVTFIQLPFYVTSPGMAKELSPIVKVEDGYTDKEGSFMLTTIRVSQANAIEYLWAKMSDYQFLFSEEDMRPHGETDEEYNQLQLRMMDSSQEAASYVAYKHAGKHAEIKKKGVYVVRVIDDMPANEELQTGDRIYEIDNQKVVDAEALISYVSTKSAGDTVTIKLVRNGEKKTVTIPLKPFPNNKKRVGLGIQLDTDKEIIIDPKVEIDTSKIGGPSAGLMFSLEIYNQLVERDMTKGYNVAGTGTINIDGIVGRIGGIKQKVVAADKAGADIFFAPNEEGKKGSNYEEALEAAQDINTSMKIVPVDTFYEAVSYLDQLT